MLLTRCLVAVLLQSIVVTTFAADNKSLAITSGETLGRYNGTPYRDSLIVRTVNVDIEVAKKWGVSFGFEHTRIDFKYGIPEYLQNALFLSFRSSKVPLHQLHNIYAKYLPELSIRKPGRYTTRMDFYCVADRKDKYDANNTCIFAPQVSYMRLDKSRYADLGYAFAQYPGIPQDPLPFYVEQWTPTLGFALNDRDTHWLQLRAYFLHYSNERRSQGRSRTQAVEVKYLYYPISGFRAVPTYLEASSVFGERMYSVDRDSNSVNNLSDVEKSSVSFGARWQFNHRLGLLLSVNRKHYDTQSPYFKYTYALNTGWLGLEFCW